MTFVVRKFVCRLIERYQLRGGGTRFFATDCNFTPTCSEYAKQAIEHRGLVKGMAVALNRLRRCTHPDLVEKIYDPFVADSHADV